MQANKQLREWRIGKGFSQVQVADAVGVKQATWSEWESGKKPPSARYLGRIEALTGGEIPIAAWATIPKDASTRIAKLLKTGTDA